MNNDRYQRAADALVANAASHPLTGQQRLEINYYALLGMMTQRLSEANTVLKPELVKMCEKAGRAAEGMNYA